MKHETEYNGWTHEKILEALSDAINVLDRNYKFGLADELLDIIIALKTEWGMPLD